MYSNVVCPEVDARREIPCGSGSRGSGRARPLAGLCESEKDPDGVGPELAGYGKGDAWPLWVKDEIDGLGLALADGITLTLFRRATCGRGAGPCECEWLNDDR
jgi:hypothetical protein